MKNYKLQKEFATKWIAALRSGEYAQSNEKLLNDHGYCCLGVACKIKGIDDKDLFGQTYPGSMLPEVYQASEDENHCLWLEVAELNDNCLYSFPKIADWIEQNVEFI